MYKWVSISCNKHHLSLYFDRHYNNKPLNIISIKFSHFLKERPE